MSRSGPGSRPADPRRAQRGCEVRKVVLPAAGHGTRLRPLTHFIPKEMLPVGDRLVAHHVLAECLGAGMDRLLAVVSRAKGALVEALERITAEEAGEGLYPQVYYVYQRVQGGLGHAILHAEAFAGGEPFAVVLPDTVLHASSAGSSSLLSRLLEAHVGCGAAVTVAVERVPRERLSRYGIVRPADASIGDPRSASGEPFPIVDFVEKPKPEEAPSNLAISARYVFSPEIFPALSRLDRGSGSEFQLTDAMAALARAGRTVIGVPLAPGERRLDIGNHDSYAEAWKVLAGGN